MTTARPSAFAREALRSGHAGFLSFQEGHTGFGNRLGAVYAAALLARLLNRTLVRTESEAEFKPATPVTRHSLPVHPKNARAFESHLQQPVERPLRAPGLSSRRQRFVACCVARD